MEVGHGDVLSLWEVVPSGAPCLTEVVHDFEPYLSEVALEEVEV